MKKIIVAGLVIGFLFTVSSSAEQAVPPVGYAALADFDHLWLYTGKVNTGMFSSTDPKAGNLDMWNFHGRYRGEPVLAKIDGPGCIYRVWSALASGWFKVYLDGSSRPEISCGFKNYLEGKCPGLPGDFSVGRTANYMPIPFAKSIIITAPGFSFPAYYQVSFQTYDKSVPVKSFKKQEAGSGEAYDAAVSKWKEMSGEEGLAQSSNVAEGRDRVILQLTGAGIIRGLSITNPDAPQKSLPGARLELFWDNNPKPSVDVPLDAFFINQPDLRGNWPGGALKNLFVIAGAGGYLSRFPMPFADGAKITVSAPGSKIRVLAIVEKRDSLPANAMRFHAFYRSQEFPENEKKENIFTFRTPISPEKNWVVLEEQGRGHYLGCALFVKSVGTVWWGEGDEMTYIDGSARPQIQGTGTEDEFNWSWGYAVHMKPVSGTLPVVPACKESIAAQIIPALRNKQCQKIRGDNIAYRFRPSDYVPFEKSIKVSYEILGNTFLAPHFLLSGNLSQERGDDYASIAYWYERP
jgi:hypothetical protein